jgi:hypothetical protein
MHVSSYEALCSDRKHMRQVMEMHDTQLAKHMREACYALKHVNTDTIHYGSGIAAASLSPPTLI